MESNHRPLSYQDSVLTTELHARNNLLYNITMRIFKKLIRDNVPEIMAKEGNTLNVRVLENDEEYKEALRRKVVEEISELKEAETKKEALDKIAYIHEIAEALGDIYGLTNEEVHKHKEKTRHEKGGFQRRLFLEGEK
jgi:predicted house-cleaning noncanonical NTP pyrophosphatase (MazG superfamily)